MTLQDLVQELQLEVICGHEHLQRTCTDAYVSDLLSDVMGRGQEGQLWITLQTHKNVVAIASLKDMAAVLFINGYRPQDEVVHTAQTEEVVLLASTQSAFAMAGQLYTLLHPKA